MRRETQGRAHKRSFLSSKGRSPTSVYMYSILEFRTAGLERKAIGKITNVFPGSPAKEAGFQVGDLLTEELFMEEFCRQRNKTQIQILEETMKTFKDKEQQYLYVRKGVLEYTYFTPKKWAGSDLHGMTIEEYSDGQMYIYNGKQVIIPQLPSVGRDMGIHIIWI